MVANQLGKIILITEEIGEIGMKNKIVMITAALAVMMAMTGIAAADQLTIYNGLPHTLANKVTTLQLTIGSPAVAKDLVVDSFLQPAGTAHTLTYTVSDPLGPAAPSDIVLQFQELTPPGVLGNPPYAWTQDAALQELLTVTFKATASAVPGTTYQIQVTDLATGNSFTADAVVAATAIPEFATIAMPIAAVLGLVFFFQQRKNKKE